MYRENINTKVAAYARVSTDLEDCYSYILDHNKFKPSICKRDGDGLLRVFELPFNTGEDEEWIIYLVAQHAVTRYFAPVDISLIENMPDVSYDDWWAECQRKKQADVEWSDTELPDFSQKIKTFEKIIDKL